MNDRIVRANGVDLCVETFGRPRDPAILLVHGASASMLAWEEGFCAALAAGEALAEGGRFVIRYDHRDTGRSVSYPVGAPPYTLRDLLGDAIGLLDVLEVQRAHVVGRSMGGAIAMLAALDHPDRVSTLTLMATSAGGAGLSPPSPAFLDHLRSGQRPDWSDRESAIDHVLGLLRVFDGGTPHWNESAMREQIGHDVDRTRDIAASQTNHFLIALGEPFRHRLGTLDLPTLVIHGERDPVFPLDHARALAAEIPGAELLLLPDTGHLVLAPTWDVVVPAILSHTSSHTSSRAIDRRT